jgi:predicted dehydrogenase
MILSKDDGLVAHLHMDFLQRKVTRSCKVIGEHGSLIWNLVENSITFDSSKGSKTLFDESKVDRNTMYLNQLRHFMKVANGSASPSVGVSDALYVLQLIEVLRTSSNNNKPMSIRDM